MNDFLEKLAYLVKYTRRVQIHKAPWYDDETIPRGGHIFSGLKDAEIIPDSAYDPDLAGDITIELIFDRKDSSSFHAENLEGAVGQAYEWARERRKGMDDDDDLADDDKAS